MKVFCYGVTGFCCYLVPLSFIVHHFIICAALVIIATVAFAAGSHSVSAPTGRTRSQNLENQPGANGDELEVLPPVVSRQAVAVPDIFDPDRIRQDLVSFASQPTLFAKYAERARSRFNKAGERALLEQWITYHETGRRLIESRTEMEKCRSQWLQLANEHALSAKQKDAEIAKLEADMEENALRRDTAAYKREHLAHFINGAPVDPGGPKLSPEQQRRLKRMEIEDKLKELDRREEEALESARDDADHVRIENMYEEKREELREQLAKNLI